MSFVAQFQGHWELWKTFTVHWTLSCQKIKESLIPQDVTLNKCTNTWTPVRHWFSVRNSSACCIRKQFPFTHFPSDIPLSLRCSTLPLCHFCLFQCWMFFRLVSLLSLFSVTLLPSMPAISANLLSRRLFLCFSLPSITLMNSDGGSRVMAGAVSASASSPFWQIAPINLIYHYFPSSFNKFLWASPPLMTRWLRRGLAAVMAPSRPDYPLFRCSGCRSHAHMSTFVFFHKCSHQRQNRVSGGIMLTLAHVAVWTNA